MITVTKTYLPDIEKYKQYIDEIYQSGWLTNNGKMVRELEVRLKEYLGVKNIVLVANGTMALNLAYKLLGLKGEIITTPFSFVATTSSMVWDNLRPVFVDIDENSFNIDTSKIEEKINKKTSAIVPVHVFGNACNIDEIEHIAKKNKLKVIYDASHCFGVEYKNKNILNYGDISTISFHSTKLFHTIEGGAIVINDDDLYKKAKQLINFGFDGRGKIEGLGVNYKMNEFQAAMGLCMLPEIKNIVKKRREIYEYYMKELKNINYLEFQNQNLLSSENYSYLPVVFRDEQTLKKCVNKMNYNDIFPRRYFYPSLNKLDYIKCKEEFIKSESISERILCLPLYESLDKKDIDKIIQILKSC